MAWLYFVHNAVVFGPGENVHSAEGGTASEELRVGPSGEVPGNECAARPGGSFLFVCACTIVTLIRFLCHLDVFFGIQVDMVVVVGGTSGETEKADCRRMGWKLGCFQRGFFFFPLTFRVHHIISAVFRFATFIALLSAPVPSLFISPLFVHAL